MRSIRLHPAADDELITATAWYVERSAAAAAAFAREVDLNFPYDVVYRVSETIIEIVAIAHHARKPGYWRYRA